MTELLGPTAIGPGVPTAVLAEPLSGLGPMAAVLTAAVFAGAAVAKALDPTGTAKGFADLGLPFPRLLARLVPPTEAAVAVALVLRPAIGGLAAVAMLVGFTAVLARVVHSGRSVVCGCLGALDRRPVGPWTLARNGVLMALASVATAAPSPEGLTPVLPRPELVMALGLVGLLGGVLVQLVVLRERIGHVWAPIPAGEGDSTRRSRREVRR